MLRLRDYQETFVNAIKDAWTRALSVLAIMATGGGKTISFAALIHDHTGASAAVVHRKEIVGQISMALAALEVKHRIVAPPAVIARIRKKHYKKFGKSFIDPHALCGVVSVQTLTSRGAAKNAQLQAWIKQVTLVIYDEGHHYVAKGFWARAVRCYEKAKKLFITATPRRADGQGLGEGYGGFAQEIVEGPGTLWLQKRGYLVRTVYKAKESNLDVHNIPITPSGDLNTKEMRKRIEDSDLVGDVVQQYLEYAKDKKAIVFANDVVTAKETALEFQRRGVSAKALDSDTESAERDRALDDFEDGKISVLVNVDLFDEGFDVPEAEVAILARRTESLAKYMQMIGRILRPVYAEGFDLSTVEGRLAAIAASTKPHGLVLDPVGNWEIHGPYFWPHQWTLEGTPKGYRDTEPERKCVACAQPYRIVHRCCPYCGHEYRPTEAARGSIKGVDGVLRDLDLEAFETLMKEYGAANMSDEDFTYSLYQRGVPAIGHHRQLRAHQAAKYRRKVLKELVGWWAGCQPHRTADEIQTRFFHRFGIDVVSAYTLSAEETDALIEKIKQKFSEDCCDDVAA